MEGAGNLPCPEVCRQERDQVKDGYLVPANNQFLALSPTTKYSIMPVKGERIVVTYVLLKTEHIASYQHTLLKKKGIPVPAFAYPVRKRLIKKGPDPYDPGCPVCVQDGSVVKHFSSTTNSLHTLHLDTGYCDPSLDGKCYFLAAGLRVQHEDKIMLVPFFILVENKRGLTVSQEVFQLIDYIATCKQLQAFHGSRVLRILSDQGTEFVNQGIEKHARQRGIHLATSPAHQPQSNGVARRLVGLAKQCTRRLLLAAGVPDFYWSYAIRFVAEMLRHNALGFQWHVPAFGEEVGMWRSHDKQQAKSAHHKGAVGRLIAIELWGNGTCVLIAKGSDPRSRACPWTSA